MSHPSLFSGRRPDGPPIKAAFHLSDKGVTGVQLTMRPPPQGFAWEILGKQDAALAVKIEAWVDSYCRREQPAVSLPLLLEGLPPFTRQVLGILQQQPFGKTLSYQQLALAADKPRGARAVGGACGRNPCLLLIPCHRVVAADGGLGGFSGGPEIKQTLLAFEGASKFT